MDLRRLQRVVIDALEDIKALDIKVFDTAAITSLFDRIVIATATSNRQTRALASHLREKVKAAGGDVIATEGEETGEWVLVDLGDIVVHLMQPAIRTYYDLEEIWGGKPVRVKLGGKPATASPSAAGASASRTRAAAAPAAVRKRRTATTDAGSVPATAPAKAGPARKAARPAARPARSASSA